MIELDNQTSLDINLKALNNIALELTKQTIELLIVEDKTIIELNKQYRNKEVSTDVLSFPIDNSFIHSKQIDDLPLGSVVIASSFVLKEAKIFAHTNQEEFSLLFIHGLLHLLGFDHEEDNGEMRKKEENLIKIFNLPKSLIVRVGGKN